MFGESSLELITPMQKHCDYWQDALDTLLNKSMTSEQMKVDLDLLLDFEVKLRLLDLEEVDLPNEAPIVPPPPPALDIHV